MKRVLVDTDGVLADFTGPVLAWAQTINPALRLEDTTEFDFLSAWGLPAHKASLDALVHTPGFCRNLAPLPGAAAFVEALRSADFDVVAVTWPYHSSPTWCHERTAWLREHCGFTAESVVFTSRKSLVQGDVLVDDAGHNLDGFPGARVLIDRPWNQGYWGEYFRCFTLAGALALITRGLK